MISRAALAFVVVAAACGGDDARAPRERVLARIPAGVMAVVAADGEALAHARTRAVIDVLRPRWPARLGCAIDAALAADHVALGVTPARAAVLVLETRAEVRCAALSRVATAGDRATWVATLGSAAPVEASGPRDPASSAVLGDARFARARPYLLRAPVAVAIDVPGGSAIATATPEPAAAWLAIDMAPMFADAAERHVRGYVERLVGEPQAADLARGIEIQRTGAQIVARLDALPATADLPAAVRVLLGWHGGPRPRGAGAAFTCPPLAAPIVRCTAGTRFEVSALAAAVAPLIAARTAPVIANGVVAGLRLEASIPTLGLRVGDVVVAAQGQPIATRAQLAEVLGGARGVAHLTISRDGASARLQLVAP